jgi:hypothetical protein
MNHKTKSFLLLVIVLLSQACSNEPEATEVDLGDATSDTMQIAPEVLNDLVGSIPTPIEMSSALIASGAEYNNALLNPSDNVDGYSTANQKAFNLGVYGADLAYINNYGKSMYSLNCLASIKRLADDLRIGQFFDLETMKRLTENSNNTDSLIYLSTQNFNTINNHLRENRKSALSVLMITGAWLEGMHIASQVYASNPSEELQRIIAEQKVVLDRIAVVVGAFPGDPYFAELSGKLASVKVEFDKIDIRTEYKPPTKKVVNGNLVVQDNSATVFDIPPGVLDGIVARIAATRNSYIR